MAVFQISRIQIRRGKKNQGTGLPQLASGELAWAIDTQELFIGNGAISEGAPAVGNTKILTTKDSLLSIAAQYQYKYDAELQTTPVSGTILRTLQSRLDDGNVSARNFGILPSSELDPADLDQTDKIQTAINSISTTTRVVLEFDPGIYQFSETIVLPSHVKIKGFGKDNTIFKYIGNGIAFDTVVNGVNQQLGMLSILVTTDDSICLRLQNTTKGKFSNLKLAYDTVTSIAGLPSNNRVGLILVGSNIVSNNTYDSIEFKNLTYGIYSNSSPSFNSFSDCLFEFLYQGAVFEPGSGPGANYNMFKNSVFDKITSHALVVENGKGNISTGNRFKDVGATLSGTSSAYSIIKFVTSGNSSVNDTFERPFYLESNDSAYSSNPYVPELEGVGLLDVRAARKISLPSTLSASVAFRLPLNSASSIKIDYLFNSTTYGQTRKGSLDIVVDRVYNRVQLSDEYEYTGDDPLGEDAIIFTAELETKTSGDVSAEHIRINFINKNTNDINQFIYTYSILS